MHLNREESLCYKLSLSDQTKRIDPSTHAKLVFVLGFISVWYNPMISGRTMERIMKRLGWLG